MTSTQADLLIADARRAPPEIGRWGRRPKDLGFQRARAQAAPGQHQTRTGVPDSRRRLEARRLQGRRHTQVRGTSAMNALVDPRLAFLARASARLVLVEVGEMDLNEAFDDLIEFVC